MPAEPSIWEQKGEPSRRRRARGRGLDDTSVTVQVHLFEPGVRRPRPSIARSRLRGISAVPRSARNPRARALVDPICGVPGSTRVVGDLQGCRPRGVVCRLCPASSVASLAEAADATEDREAHRREAGKSHGRARHMVDDVPKLPAQLRVLAYIVLSSARRRQQSFEAIARRVDRLA